MDVCKEIRMEYKDIAREIRMTVLTMIYKAQVSHIGSNFSIIDVLTVLYEKLDPKKDMLIVSKGWVAASVYALGVRKGYMPQEAIDTFCQEGSKYIGLLEPMNMFGAQFAGGSMGYGAPFGVGVALAKKMKGEGGNVYVVMSDGEMAIGTTWESALIAAHHKLDNLVVIVDNNGFQAMGTTKHILDTGILERKFWEFGFEAVTIDGHDYDSLEPAIQFRGDRPRVIICDTVKGKGVSFMENENEWHYRHLDQEHYELAAKELG